MKKYTLFIILSCLLAGLGGFFIGTSVNQKYEETIKRQELEISSLKKENQSLQGMYNFYKSQNEMLMQFEKERNEQSK